MPYSVPGNGNKKWPLPCGDKQIGKQTIVIHGKHPGVGEPQGSGSREKGVTEGFFKLVNITES